MLNASAAFFQSSTGWVYAVNLSTGRLIWSFDTGFENPGNVALQNGALYVASGGVLYALDAEDGTERWHAQVATSSMDASSLVATEGVLLVPCNSNSRELAGSEQVVAVNASNGATKWRYRLRSRGFNLMPAVFGNSLVFSDRSGGVYRINTEDGSELWYVPPQSSNEFSWTTGGIALGNGVAFVSSNTAVPVFGGGILSAYDLVNGSLRWSREFSEGVNAAPTVGKVAGYEQLAVIVGVGGNPVLPGVPGYEVAGYVEALDAETGERIWTFSPPSSGSSGPAGFSLENQCFPELWSTPVVADNGVVYLSWSGGWTFALRDNDGDGKLSVEDTSDVSRFFHGGGAGETALAPGLVVASSCYKVMGWVVPTEHGIGARIIFAVASGILGCAVVGMLALHSFRNGRKDMALTVSLSDDAPVCLSLQPFGDAGMQPAAILA